MTMAQLWTGDGAGPSRGTYLDQARRRLRSPPPHARVRKTPSPADPNTPSIVRLIAARRVVDHELASFFRYDHDAPVPRRVLRSGFGLAPEEQSMKYRLLPAALALVTLISGCDDDDDTASAQSGTLSCESFEACGGDPTGSYSIEAVCVEGFDESFLATMPSECHEGLLDASHTATGTTNFDEDGSFDSDVEIISSVQFRIDTPCWQALSGLATEMDEDTCELIAPQLSNYGLTSGTCSFSEAACNCDGELITAEADADSYEVSGTELLIGDADPMSFCATDSQIAVQQIDEENGVTITYIGARR